MQGGVFESRGSSFECTDFINAFFNDISFYLVAPYGEFVHDEVISKAIP